MPSGTTSSSIAVREGSIFVSLLVSEWSAIQNLAVPPISVGAKSPLHTLSASSFSVAREDEETNLTIAILQRRTVQILLWSYLDHVRAARPHALTTLRLQIFG